ncbi:MAG: hypothetical protein JXD19_06595 [Deltaproteobacteria bacterium]|nr:hypothetical protein [Deltaproteobacteria bacterium]
MARLKLPLEDKKEIVLYELKRRDPRWESESITAFVQRLLAEYCYSKGAERLFWSAIRALEREGKVRRNKNGKRKNILLIEQGNGEKKRKGLNPSDEESAENRLKVIRDFLTSWNRCEYME